MSDTPRTDAIVFEFPEDSDPDQQTSLEAALIFHARQLERELAAYKKAWDEQVLHVKCAANGCQGSKPCAHEWQEALDLLATCRSCDLIYDHNDGKRLVVDVVDAFLAKHKQT